MKYVILILAVILASSCGVSTASPQECSTLFSSFESKYKTGVTTQTDALEILGEGMNHHDLADGGFTRLYTQQTDPKEGSGFCGSVTITYRNGVVTKADKYSVYN